MDLQGTCSCAIKKAGASPGNIKADKHQENTARLRVNTVYWHIQDTQRELRYLIADGYLAENVIQQVIRSKQELQRLNMLPEDLSRKT
jgi:hypothetical protein